MVNWINNERCSEVETDQRPLASRYAVEFSASSTLLVEVEIFVWRGSTPKKLVTCLFGHGVNEVLAGSEASKI
jgi:hypothetical protein